MPSDTPLTVDDRELLRLHSEGMTSEAIARTLNLSERTLRRRTRLLCDRLGVGTPIEAVLWAVRRDLI